MDHVAGGLLLITGTELHLFLRYLPMLHFIRELFKICQLQRKSNLAMVKQGADIDMRHLAAKRLHSNYRSPGGVARPVRAVRRLLHRRTCRRDPVAGGSRRPQGSERSG